MRAEIISVGTELLLGHIVDTNASYLAQELTALGIDLFWVSQVGDNKGRLVEIIRRARSRSDLTIISGGVGPTEDDLTRESIAELFGEEMVVDPVLERDLRAYFQRRGRVMPERNVKQATLIPSCEALLNPIGTAPGWWVHRDNRMIAAMPGVPPEMHRMWQNEVVPRLLRIQQAGVIYTRILKVLGLGESTVEEMIGDYLACANPTIATYAKSDGIHVRITAKADNIEKARSILAPLEASVRTILGDNIYGIDGETLDQVVGRLLQTRRLTLATMEAMTGGLLANAMSDGADSGRYYDGGLVAPSVERLVTWSVSADIIAEHGAISVAVAAAMARIARQSLGSALGLALAGVAGPQSEEGQQPGSLHIAINDRGETTTQSIIGFGNTREQVKTRAVLAALDFLRRYLQDK